MVIIKVFTDTKKKKKNHLSNPQRAERGPSTEAKARLASVCAWGSEQPRGQDCLSEGMQRSSAPKLCSGHAGVSGVGSWHLRSSGPCYNTRLTGSHTGGHRLLLCPHRAGATDPSTGTGLSLS